MQWFGCLSNKQIQGFFFFQLSVLVPLAVTKCFIKTSFWKMSCLSKKKKKRKEKYKKQSPRGWHLIRDGEGELSYQLQTFAMEMTNVLKAHISYIDLFHSTHTFTFFCKVLFWSNLPVFLKEGVPVPLESRKRDVRRRHDLIADMGNER